MDNMRDPNGNRAYIQQLRNNFQRLADVGHAQTDTAGIETVWKQVRLVYTQTSDACFERKRQK